MVTRYQGWPHQSDRDTTIELSGFPQARKVIRRMNAAVGDE